MQIIENDAEIIYEGKKLKFDTTEGIQRAEAFIRMKEVVDLETGLKVPRTKVSFCYNSLTPKAPSEPFVVPCIEGRGRKKKGENLMTHVVMRFPSCVCVPIPVRTQATRTIKGSKPVTAKIALEIAKKWVKLTYGNVDYMCGIHIDQPDMLVHFLLFIKEANIEGEEIARNLFTQYHLDQLIESSSKEVLEEEKELKKEQKPEAFDRVESKKQPEKAINSFGNMPSLEELASFTKQDSREQVMAGMKQEKMFAAKPSQRQEDLDIASIVARVRASSTYQTESIAEATQMEKQTEAIEETNLIREEKKSSKDMPEKDEEESHFSKPQNKTSAKKQQLDESQEQTKEPEMDPLAKIKANAASTLFGLSQVISPVAKETNTTAEAKASISDEGEEKVTEKEEKNHYEPMIYVNEAYQKKEDSAQKEETLKKEAPVIYVNEAYQKKVENDSDHMLYDESEYAKTPVGSVVWGTEVEQEQFPEEKKVQAVFSTRNLSVMAEENNPYLEDDYTELPEISFFVQNEAGEKEIPEEYQFQPSERTLQQRDAAANYVKSLKKAKWKKAGIIGGSILIIVIIAILAMGL